MELDNFREMWTTEAANYVLTEHEDGYLPVNVSGREPMVVLIDEDDELADAVCGRMIAAGVPVLDPATFASRFANPS